MKTILWLFICIYLTGCTSTKNISSCYGSDRLLPSLSVPKGNGISHSNIISGIDESIKIETLTYNQPILDITNSYTQQLESIYPIVKTTVMSETSIITWSTINNCSNRATGVLLIHIPESNGNPLVILRMILSKT